MQAELERGRRVAAALDALVAERAARVLVDELDLADPGVEQLLVLAADERSRPGIDEAAVHAVAQDQPVVGIEQRECVLDALDGARQPVGGEPRDLLEAHPLGDIADRRRDRLARRPELRREADLDGQLAAVLAAPVEAQPRAHRPRRGLREEAAQVRAVTGAEPLRDQELERPADQLVARVAEQRLGLHVDQLDVRVLADDDDRVRRRVDQRGVVALLLGVHEIGDVLDAMDDGDHAPPGLVEHRAC